MILYFALAIPVSAALMLALRAFLRRRGQERSVLFYAGLAHVLVGLPLLGSLSLAIGAGIIAAGAVLMVLGSFSMPAAAQGLACSASAGGLWRVCLVFFRIFQCLFDS
jgi:hypothetical protein